LVAEVSQRSLKNEPLLAEIESLLSELIEWLANQRRNRRGVNDGRSVDAVTQAFHHHCRDDVNAMPINQALLATRRCVLLISDNKGADGPMAKHGVDQCYSGQL